MKTVNIAVDMPMPSARMSRTATRSRACAARAHGVADVAEEGVHSFLERIEVLVGWRDQVEGVICVTTENTTRGFRMLAQRS